MKNSFFILTSLLMILFSHQAYAQDSCLIAYFPFTNGSTADSSGHGHVGTNFGALSTVDHFGNESAAFEFFGGNEWIEFGDTLGNFGLGDFSISFWIQSTATNNMKIIGKRLICDPANFWNISLKNGKIEVELEEVITTFNRVVIIGNTSVADSNWHHIVFVREQFSLKLYIDHIFDSQATANPIRNFDNTGPFKLGKEICAINGWSDSYSGAIDNVRIYECALSESDIIKLHTVSIHRPVIAGEIEVFPNPSSGQFVIKSAATSIDKIELFDITGRKISFLLSSSTPYKALIQTNHRGLILIRISSQDTHLNKRIIIH